MKPVVSNGFFWLLTSYKKCVVWVTFQMCISCEQLHQINFLYDFISINVQGFPSRVLQSMDLPAWYTTKNPHSLARASVSFLSTLLLN